MHAMLIILHCESNTSYAIGTLEQRFFEMARVLLNDDVSRLHFGYPSMLKGKPETLPPDFSQYLLIDTCDPSPEAGRAIQRYIEEHRIDVVFGFDQPVHRPLYRHLRAGGVKHFISYWGAPISSVFGPIKRLLKKMDVVLHPHGPDHYIFESVGMRDTAVLGRGIAAARTSVVPLGVDPDRFYPDAGDRDYIYQIFDIPRERHIFFYSGHMETRKGVPVLLRAAVLLKQKLARHDWQLVLLGDQPGDAERLLASVPSAAVRDHITFGGYRNDLHLLHRGCYAGIIASTGWDSLTASAIEMQASGLPLLLSDLPGLREAIENHSTGTLFPAGDAHALAAAMVSLMDNPAQRNAMSTLAAHRIKTGFTADIQVNNLVAVLRQVCGPDSAYAPSIAPQETGIWNQPRP